MTSSSSSPPDDPHRAEARRLAQQLILIDGHIDAPYRYAIYPEDLSRRGVGGDFDYERARAGGLSAAFMAIYIEPHYQGRGARAQADKLIDMVWGWQHQWPAHFAVARTPAEVVEVATRGLVALPLGLENGAPLEENLGNLQHFYDRGIRYITLTHGKDNHICDSSYDTSRTWNGLSPFGRTLIPAMNRMGMMVDVSHISDAAFDQVMDLTTAPVIASHSSARHFTPGWERNLSDAMIQRIAAQGGVVMINFGAAFLGNHYRVEDDHALKAVRQQMTDRKLNRGTNEALAFFSQARRDHPIGTVDDVVDHIDHVVRLAGIDHVGLGSDFDGVFGLPAGLQEVSDYPNLIAALLRRGYAEADIARVLGENTLRVWTEIAAAAP